MGTIGNSYSSERYDEAVLATKLNKVASGNLDMNGFAVTGLTNINGGAISGFKNRLINPLFQVDIEGNAGGVTTSVVHVVEGWRMGASNAVTTQTISRATGNTVPYSLKYVVTTGSDTSISATDFAGIGTSIEGYDISDAFWGTANAKSIWISGRIKAPTTGIYCVGLKNAGNDRAYAFDVECIAGTWVDFEKEIPGDTSGTWDKTNGVGLNIWFGIAWGSDYHITADTWSAGNYYSTANQANGLATNGNIYEIEDIRVSVGGPIPTEWRPYAVDLAHCQRYYEKGYILARAWLNTITGNANDHLISPMNFKVTKRSTPTGALSGTGAGTYTVEEITSEMIAVKVVGPFTTSLSATWSASARMI